MENWQEAKKMLEQKDIDLDQETNRANKVASYYCDLKEKLTKLAAEVAKMCFFASKIYSPSSGSSWDTKRYSVSDYKIRFYDRRDYVGRAGFSIKKKHCGMILDFSFIVNKAGQIEPQKIFTLDVNRIEDLVRLIDLLSDESKKIEKGLV
jgi:predicted nucleic acid-binding Zn finger protein